MADTYDAQVVWARISERLRAMGLSSRAASLAATGNPDAIRNIERAAKRGGGYDPRSGTIARIAAVLETTPAWILDDPTADDTRPDPRSSVYTPEGREPEFQDMPVLGVVEAGAWRIVSPHPKPGKRAAVARDPQFASAPQFLLKVQGDSMDAASPPMPEGVLLRCVSWPESGLSLRSGQIVVARRFSSDNLCETTVKRVHVFPDRIELRPESSNPVHEPIIIPTDDHPNVEIIGVVTGVHWDVRF